MHELAIAQRLIETAVALLPPDTKRVEVLKIELGALAGLSEEELRFGFEMVSAETPCAGARLEVTHLPAIGHCPECGADFTLTAGDIFVCPSCESLAVIVMQGKELLITSLEAVAPDDPAEPAAANEAAYV